MSEGSASPSGSKPAAEELGTSNAAETLSQFVARVLTQLSLSAWLPSAALVLSLYFVFQLGVVLERPKLPADAWSALTATLGAMASINLGGAVLLFVAVVVLTIFTQAFSFEAIRFLEGYWGVVGPVEWLARWRCSHFEKRAIRLRRQYARLTTEAWREARTAIEREQSEAISRADSDSDVRGWTPEMLTYLGSRLTEQYTDVSLSRTVRLEALRIPWQEYASADHLRRRANVDKKLRDYPQARRCRPTLLGNVLRAYEDATERSPVETFVLDLYDTLPITLRIQHDEHRNRLDLYASMIFVELLVTVIAGVRLESISTEYLLAAMAGGLAASWLTYRAAIASARTYGILLVNIAQRFPMSPQSDQSN